MATKIIKIIPISYVLWSIMSTCQSQIAIANAGGETAIANAGVRLSPNNSSEPNFNSPYYGSQNKGECYLKSFLLNPQVIEATRGNIRQCTAGYYDCGSAQSNKFRTIDGSCNNLQHPSWGKSENCLQRILPFDYADGKSVPRVAYSGKPLPNPRNVSNKFHIEPNPTFDNEHTTHFMEWGQMVGHDLSLNDVFRTSGAENNFPIDCCSNGPVTNDMCMSVPVPPDDPVYKIACLPFSRTVPCSVCNSGQRISSNKNTAFHDLSLTYGSTEATARQLRSGDRGMLVVENHRKSGPMPPTVPKEDECFSPSSKPACYHAGDKRVNMNPFILTVQIYLLRHHNYICQELSKINKHWDDERLYQEARRINIAIAQYITYKWYLPEILGEIVQQEGIQVLPGANYTNYDPELDPTIADEFTCAAARYGHPMIPGNISVIHPRTGKKDTVRLKDYFYTPFKFKNGLYDKFATGMTMDKCEKHNWFLNGDVRSQLYRQNREGLDRGGDLAALSITRGRDHGIAGFTHYVYHYSKKLVKNFEDLKNLLPPKAVDLLESIYECVHDVDLYSAGLTENHVQGGLVGLTFARLLAEQYKKLKFGDRYWFEHQNQAGSFTPEQLIEIKKSSLARILCVTTKLRKIQINPFFPPSTWNPVVPCDKIHSFDFNLWYEESEY